MDKFTMKDKKKTDKWSEQRRKKLEKEVAKEKKKEEKAKKKEKRRSGDATAPKEHAPMRENPMLQRKEPAKAGHGWKGLEHVLDSLPDPDRGGGTGGKKKSTPW